MSDPLWCPLMGGKPCMGRMCACAVRSTDYDYDYDLDPDADSEAWPSRWYCGLLPRGETGLQRYVDEEPNDDRRD